MKPYFYTEPQLDFNDILLVPSIAEDGVDVDSRSKVNLTRRIVTPYSSQVMTGIPIIAANMDGVGTFRVADALHNVGCYTALHKHHSIESLVEFYSSNNEAAVDLGFSNENNNVFYSMGSNEADYNKFTSIKNTLLDKGVRIPNICFDVANLYSKSFHKIIERIRHENPTTVIMAGNVVTLEAVEALGNIGVDIVKLGIGPSSVCTTRTQTGVGYPQLSCIMNIASRIGDSGPLLCSDGGCNNPGDFSKAFAAGADFVMTGSMLAGTDEGGGRVVDGMVEFYGMSSKTANEKHFGGLQGYRSSEGRTVRIPYKGSINSVIQDILGGIRSTCTYVGVNSLEDLEHKARYVRVNNNINRSFEKYTVGN